MLDIRNNRLQGSSGGLSSRPSQISPQIRRDRDTIPRRQNYSSSPQSAVSREEQALKNRRRLPSSPQGQRYGSADAIERRSNPETSRKERSPNLRGMSADAAERWSNPANSRKERSPNLRGMSADAAERWSNPANSRKERSPNTRGMSADAAERWSGGTKTRSNQSSASSNTWNNALSGAVTGTAVGAFAAARQLPYPNRIASHVPENTPRVPYHSYGYDTGQITSDPSKRLNFSQRQQVWRAMADDPKAPLTEVQRQQIRATPRGQSAAPTWWNTVTGKMERMELSHEPRPHRQGGQVVVPRWPEDHAAGDDYRHLSRSVRNAYENQGDAIRRNFALEVVVNEWGYKVDLNVLRGEKPPVVQQVSRPSPVLRTLENSHVQGVARGTFKVVLAPVAIGLDAWQLGSAYKKDGFGQEFRSTAGSVAGAWGGAAAGAAIGSAIFPGVGTVVGGVIGGVAGSAVGDDIVEGAEKAGKSVEEVAKFMKDLALPQTYLLGGGEKYRNAWNNTFRMGKM